MKISSHNFISPNYEDQHILYVGTHTGSFKRIDTGNKDDPYEALNLQNIEALNKNSRVTCLSWGDENRTQILIGRASKIVKVYDCENNDFTSNLEAVDDTPIVGLARYDGFVIAGLGNGKIQIFQSAPQPVIFSVGENLSRMRQCPQNPKLVATGGKEHVNRLQIWDLATKERIFQAKNMPNDSLQVEVPVWDNDFRFCDESTLATCSRYGYIRFYDTRKQRRPVLNFQSKDPLSFSCLAVHDHSIVVGLTTGGLRAFDARHLKYQIHTYKGFTGSVTDLDVDATGKFIFSSSLDRYVRVHDLEQTALLYQNYVKSKATSILMKPVKAAADANQTDDSVVFVENADESGEVAGSRDDDDGVDDYEKLFENMEKIEHDRNEPDEVTEEKSDEPPMKKRKRKHPKKK